MVVVAAAAAVDSTVINHAFHHNHSKKSILEQPKSYETIHVRIVFAHEFYLLTNKKEATGPKRKRKQKHVVEKKYKLSP